MEAVFLKLVNLSLTASVLVFAVLLVRLVFRKAPKWLFCLLWGLVALRLIFPFSIESALSLIPSAEPLPQEILNSANPQIQSGIASIDNAVNSALSQSMVPNVGNSVNPTQVWSFILSWIWIIGACIMLGYALLSSARLRWKLRTATVYQKGIKQSEYVSSPFVLGILRPTIYLPYRMEDSDLFYVIAHEKSHIRRKDHWWKPLGFLLLAIYWFNPLLWLAYILLCRDIEAACDERVIREMNRDALRAYSTALLHCSVHRRQISACPLAFGEIGVKQRVKTIMRYQKPAFWIVLSALVVSAVVAVCFLTSPRGADAVVFQATVVEIRDGSMLVEPTADSNEILSSDRILVPMKHMDASPEPQIGDLLEISYNGEILESYPASLGEVFRIRVVQQTESGSALERPMLTLDDVRWLSQKAESLTWSDFEPYACIEAGSGLYIQIYEIDASYSVWIGGSSPQEEPMYIYLYRGEERLDLRTGDLEAFLAGAESVGQLLHANGFLYQNTGEVSKVTERCGTPDGCARERLAENEIPTKDGQCNFGTDVEYQYAANDYLEVYVNQNWYIFKAVGTFFTDCKCVGPSPEPTAPHFQLINGHFEFSLSAFSSDLYYGSYTLTEDRLTMTTYDQDYTFVFERDGTAFTFRAAESTALPTFRYAQNEEAQAPFEDGAVFEAEVYSN